MELLKNLSKRTKFILFIIYCVITFNVVLFYVDNKNITNNAPPLITKTVAAPKQNIDTSPGLPKRLKIPSINIDVPLEYVGVTPSGAMDIPKSTEDVGWFELGKRPGEIGNAVLAGHYGLYAGKPSVFDNLHELKKGDKIIIEDEKGALFSFVVRERRSFDPAADATVVFSSDDEKSHLNLITCEGTWNKNAKSYSQRLVVFADKE
jgi:LPXTG-site transpeptidase (sortase) family protein